MSKEFGGPLTTGPIARTLLIYSLPVLGSNILQSINGSINALWVGHFLGEVGLVATANANLVIFLIISMIFGFGMASTILIGQHMGRGEVDVVRKATGTGFTLFLIASLLIAALGWLATPLMLRAMGTPADVYPSAVPYLRMMFAGMPPALVTVYLSMTLRGAGDSMTPLVAMLPGIVVEVGLNPVFILGIGPAPELGIAGSALATLLANLVISLTLIVLIYRRDLPIRLRGAELRHLRPAGHLVRFIFAKGVPLGLQMIVLAGSAIVMMVLVNQKGTATVAAYGAVNQIWTYIQMPSFAIGMAVSGMAAQNIGAGLWHRVDRIAWTGMGINLALTGSVVAATLLLDGPILRLFLPGHEDAVAIGQHINLLAGWSFIIQGLTLVLSSVVRANGAGMVPLLILFVAFIPGRVGFAVGAEPLLSTDAIWWSFPIGSIISLALNQVYYRRGDWKKLTVAAPEAVKAAAEHGFTA
ncbi:MAG: MATE family efflux transporter [Sphingobium sp.]